MEGGFFGNSKRWDYGGLAGHPSDAPVHSTLTVMNRAAIVDVFLAFMLIYV